MAVQAGDVEAMRKLERASHTAMLIWFGWMTILVLFPVMGLSLPFILGLITSSQFGVGFYFYMGFLALTFVLIIFLPRRAAKVNESILLTPLGLRLAQTPEMQFTPRLNGPRVGVRGATLIEGSRHGRPIKIVIQSGTTTTIIGAPAPSFVIHSPAGKLTAESGAPKTVQQAIKGLHKAKRWERLELSGGAEGIQAVMRRGRGQNMWLYDLWLCERILEAMQV